MSDIELLDRLRMLNVQLSRARGGDGQLANRAGWGRLVVVVSDGV